MNRTHLAAFSTILVLGFLVLWAAPARAVTVAIVTPPRSTPDWTEALSRLRGELLSVGFEVRMIHRSEDDAAPDRDSRAWLEEIASEGGVDAVLEIVGDRSPVAVDIWVIEQSPPRLEVSRVAREATPADASARLAIRAVEVLRSTFLESDMARRRQPVDSTEAALLDSTDELPRDRERFGFELGAAALTSLDGVGPALMPVARLDWKARAWLVVNATLAGFGSRPTVATTAGHARVAQQYATLGARHRFRPDQRLWPFVAVAAGALRTSVEGEADPPRTGHDSVEWSFLVDGGFGAGLRLPQHYTLTLTAHVQVAEPYVAIHFVDAIVATTGRPNLVLTLTVGAWP